MCQEWSELYLDKKIIRRSLLHKILANFKVPNGFLAKKCLGNSDFWDGDGSKIHEKCMILKVQNSSPPNFLQVENTP